MFGEFVQALPPVTRSFHLFHDEAGFKRGGRYGIHGMLAVPDEMLEPLGADLTAVRRKYNYWSEIHYNKLGGSRVEGSASWCVANGWLRNFFEHYLNSVRFKAFAIDTRHEEFDRVRYPTMTAAYRRFIISNGKSLIAWCLRGPGTLVLSPFTDAGNASAARVRRDGDLFQGFDRYVARECRRERLRKPFYPDVRFSHPLQPVVSSPSKLTTQQAASLGISLEHLKLLSDYIQLVDLLTGSLHAALAAEVSSEGKRRLADNVARELSRSYDLPWNRSVKQRRRFSFSCFPGPGRTPYAISLASLRSRGLASLQSDRERLGEWQSTLGFHPDAVRDELKRAKSSESI